MPSTVSSGGAAVVGGAGVTSGAVAGEVLVDGSEVRVVSGALTVEALETTGDCGVESADEHPPKSSVAAHPTTNVRARGGMLNDPRVPGATGGRW